MEYIVALWLAVAGLVLFPSPPPEERGRRLLLVTRGAQQGDFSEWRLSGAPVQLKRTEKEAAKPTEKEAVKLTGKKEGKPTRVHVHGRTGGTRRPPVNKRVMKTLEQLRAINWSCPRRLGEQMKDAETGDQGAC